jgi:hypothetical protein
LSVGAVLVQPQRFERAANAAADETILVDVADLVARAAFDTAKGGGVGSSFLAACEKAGERLLAQAGSGFETAGSRLGTMLQAPATALQTQAHSIGAIDNVDDALAAAKTLLTALVSLVEELTIDHIREHLGEIVDIVETDLGLKPNVIEDQVWALLDDFIDELEHVPPESDAAVLSNRIQLIGALRRIKRRAGESVEFPELPVEALAEALFAAIKRTGIPQEAARVACVGAGAANAVGAGRDLLHAVPFTGFGSGSIGAAIPPPEPSSNDKTYLWYPSWLANNHRRWWSYLLLVYPGDEIWISADEQQIVQANTPDPWSVFWQGLIHWTWPYDRHVIGFSPGGGVKWKDSPRIADSTHTYAFKVVDADAMEKIAWISSIACNGFEFLAHMISLEENDIASNLVNGIGAAGYGTWKATLRRPAPAWLEGLTIRTVGTLLASLEGRQTSGSNQFSEWLTLSGPDVAEMLTYKYFAESARDFTLSLLTLLNNDPGAPPEQRPRNHEEIDGVTNAFVILFQNLMMLLFSRQDYLQPFQGPSAGQQRETLFLKWMLLIGTGFGLLGGVVGAAAALGASRTFDKGVFFRKLPLAVLQTHLLFFYWLYLHQEGNTAGGTYNPYGFGSLPGYPTPASQSPYLIPYDNSAGAIYLGQGNQGFWSHNVLNVNQVYAYDFSATQGTQILAARPGTVVAFWETIPDDTNPNAFTVGPTTLTGASIAAGGNPAIVPVANAAGFAPKGQFLIADPNTGKSDDVSYTSIAGNSFQGCTWPAAGAAATYFVPGAPGAPPPQAAAIQQANPGWNFVVVRHDLDNNLAPAGPIGPYDVGPNGLGLTCAVYGHGRTGSVTSSFNQITAPVTPAIIGTKVKRGMPIMLTGNTGISFHNHCHMHVVPDPGGQYSAFMGVAFAGLPTPNAVTIPFVFADSDVGGDGVLKHFNFYTSSNAQVLS